MEKQELCYWCGKPATSREHVPPKCLFPEGKDLKGIDEKDYRKNLITVPSCDAHNLRKSNDDEYLLVCLASRVGNNVAAYLHTCTKVRRARERNPFLLNIESEDTLEAQNVRLPVEWANVNMLRLLHSFEAIARALYYYDFGVRFDGKCYIVTRLCFNPDAMKSTLFNARACKLLEAEMPHWGTEIKGSNPEIFTYQFSPEDGLKTRTLCLTFYEKTQVFVALSKMTEEKLAFQRKKSRVFTNAIFGDIFDMD